MPCSCGSGTPGGAELWINVKADGTSSPSGTKAEAIQSQQVNGGYLKQIR
jgi:hypothetical protein